MTPYAPMPVIVCVLISTTATNMQLMYHRRLISFLFRAMILGLTVSGNCNAEVSHPTLPRHPLSKPSAHHYLASLRRLGSMKNILVLFLLLGLYALLGTSAGGCCRVATDWERIGGAACDLVQF